jgi:hypothetical protein
MGGQACVFYGAAEFSRDLDLLILSERDDLATLTSALAALEAKVIAVPPFELQHLVHGHAVHFRCQRADVAGLRIDLMSSLRGIAPFEEVWARRTMIEVSGESVDMLALQDLVLAKKTQRDKDWPMIRRLVEQSYFERSDTPGERLIRFWLRELRTPELLVEVAAAHPDLARAEAVSRSALQAALSARTEQVAMALEFEERLERLADREYWAPLKRELESFRRNQRKT